MTTGQALLFPPLRSATRAARRSSVVPAGPCRRGKFEMKYSVAYARVRGRTFMDKTRAKLRSEWLFRAISLAHSHGAKIACPFAAIFGGRAVSTPLPPMDARPLASTASCKICTIRLETLCYQRAWWFRVFREILASGIRVFAIAYLIRPKDYLARSPMCFKCIRFRKNALKERSALFNWLDSYLNPMFNRVRDSLLTPKELDDARALARRAADRDFIDYEQ